MLSVSDGFSDTRLRGGAVADVHARSFRFGWGGVCYRVGGVQCELRRIRRRTLCGVLQPIRQYACISKRRSYRGERCGVRNDSTLQNSQCSINVGSTAASLSGNTLSLNLAVTFAVSYSGTKTIYLWAADAGGANSGWRSRGNWTIPAAAPPLSITADSVTPSSGSRPDADVDAAVSDSAGQRVSLPCGRRSVRLATNPAANTCAVYYSRSAHGVSKRRSYRGERRGVLDEHDAPEQPVLDQCRRVTRLCSAETP